jgi:predicted DNA-binding transcriptional regulator AlpA
VEKNETSVTSLLSESDVAKITKVSITTLWRWRRDGTGPKYLRFGKLIRYQMEDLAAWINSRPGGGE